MVHIDVMLSTWNGAVWLRPQLDSLAAQNGIDRITLSVRDDGSTDDTWHILECFAGEGRTLGRFAGAGRIEADLPHATAPAFGVRLHRGTNLGFIASFFTLLMRSDPNADGYAFCDQDDVWQPDKLARAMAVMRQASASQSPGSGPGRQTPAPIPLLYASRLTLVDESLQAIGHSGVPARGPAFANAVVENIVTGATLVMNRAARNLLVEGLERMTGIAAGPEAEVPKAAVEGVRLHDWWCYLVVSAFGQVVYDQESRILYRQHGGNQVGWRPSFLARQALRLKRLRRQGDVRVITRQAALFARIHGEGLDPVKNRMLERFLAKDRRLGARIACVIHPGVWRQGRMDGLLLRLLLLTGRI